MINQPKHSYFILNKPYNVVSQFVSSHDVPLLTGIDFEFPEGIHAIGRLDKFSEGLLILTTNSRVTRLLFQGEKPHTRKYLVQVKHVVTQETIDRLQTGVTIQIKGGVDYITTPCHVELVTDPFIFIKDIPDIIEYVPTSWLLITLTEGKYHQVRKMVNAVGHKCKRLIRVAIEELTLSDLQPGRIREIDESVFFQKLQIDNWQRSPCARYPT